jgi:tetratricopeptide (TPR) repeat protein
VKKPQLVTITVSLLLIIGIYFFGRTVPKKSNVVAAITDSTTNEATVTIDTFLTLAKKKLRPEQVMRINELEHSISRGDVKDQQIRVYQQLANFWFDSANAFEPYAWYRAEAARLENSEKSLTFAAQLFLDNLQGDEVFERRRWKAMQAKDLFERSLKLDPNNDSLKVGLGACYLFGNISATPMEGILKIREVTEKDSTNMYAQFMLGKASLLSGQYDKAVNRFEKVVRQEPSNLDAILLLGEVYERMNDKTNAAKWYRKSLSLVQAPQLKAAIEKRIADLEK